MHIAVNIKANRIGDRYLRAGVVYENVVIKTLITCYGDIPVGE